MMICLRMSEQVKSGIVSKQEIRARTPRQRRAAKGGSHDVIVRIANILLPVAAAALGAVMIAAPLTSTKDVSFILAKNNVALAKERLRITNAQYRGEDSQGRAFSLVAGSAVQASSKDPIVRLKDLSAQIVMAEGPAKLSASSGAYDMNSETIGVNGPMIFNTADGYRVVARNVNMDLKTRLLRGAGRVDGRIPLGSFSAGRMSADLAARSVVLEGGAHLHIDQRSGRGWKP